MAACWVRLAEDSSLPLTGEVSAMMTSEINTTRSHDCTASRPIRTQRSADTPIHQLTDTIKNKNIFFLKKTSRHKRLKPVYNPERALT